MAKPGRPRAMTEAAQKKFCGLISLGYDLYLAAEYIGCSPITVRREANRNPEFENDWRMAEARLYVEPLIALKDAARSNWRAASWFVERTLPQKFGKQDSRLLDSATYLSMLNETLDCVFSVVTDPATKKKISRRLHMLVSVWQDRCHGERAELAGRIVEKQPQPPDGSAVAAVGQPVADDQPGVTATAGQGDSGEPDDFEHLQPVDLNPGLAKYGRLDADPQEFDEAFAEMEQSAIARPSLLPNQYSGRYAPVDDQLDDEEDPDREVAETVSPTPEPSGTATAGPVAPASTGEPPQVLDMDTNV